MNDCGEGFCGRPALLPQCSSGKAGCSARAKSAPVWSWLDVCKMKSQDRPKVGMEPRGSEMAHGSIPCLANRKGSRSVLLLKMPNQRHLFFHKQYTFRTKLLKAENVRVFVTFIYSLNRYLVWAYNVLGDVIGKEERTYSNKKALQKVETTQISIDG